jgi:hypothetical protein
VANLYSDDTIAGIFIFRQFISIFDFAVLKRQPEILSSLLKQENFERSKRIEFERTDKIQENLLCS